VYRNLVGLSRATSRKRLPRSERCRRMRGGQPDTTPLVDHHDRSGGVRCGSQVRQLRPRPIGREHPRRVPGRGPIVDSVRWEYGEMFRSPAIVDRDLHDRLKRIERPTRRAGGGEEMTHGVWPSEVETGCCDGWRGVGVLRTSREGMDDVLSESNWLRIPRRGAGSLDYSEASNVLAASGLGCRAVRGARKRRCDPVRSSSGLSLGVPSTGTAGSGGG
jgi:hypothetical protein